MSFTSKVEFEKSSAYECLFQYYLINIKKVLTTQNFIIDIETLFIPQFFFYYTINKSLLIKKIYD
jgi:hypothetical protein